MKTGNFTFDSPAAYAGSVDIEGLLTDIEAAIKRHVVLKDEAVAVLTGNGTMRGIINSGNTWSTAYVPRLSKAKQNRLPHPGPLHPRMERVQNGADSDETGLKRYSCWCPKVISLIGETS